MKLIASALIAIALSGCAAYVVPAGPVYVTPVPVYVSPGIFIRGGGHYHR